MKFKVVFFQFCEEGSLIGIALSMAIFTILILPKHEHGMFFHLFGSSVISFSSFPCRGVPLLGIFLRILFIILFCSYCKRDRVLDLILCLVTTVGVPKSY